jgi:uncharacterized protein YxeA
MKKTILIGLSLLVVLVCSAQPISGYKSLDARNPIVFGGDHIIYQGKTITLGPKAFFIDGQFTDVEAAKYPYVFNTVNKAAFNKLLQADMQYHRRDKGQQDHCACRFTGTVL